MTEALLLEDFSIKVTIWENQICFGITYKGYLILRKYCLFKKTSLIYTKFLYFKYSFHPLTNTSISLLKTKFYHISFHLPSLPVEIIDTWKLCNSQNHTTLERSRKLTSTNYPTLRKPPQPLVVKYVRAYFDYSCFNYHY